MTVHIFAEDTISPNTMGNFVSASQRRINVRNILTDGGPHMLSFGARCVVSDPAADYLIMGISYETNNGQLKGISLPAPVDLTVITEALGGMWYAPEEMVVDKRYPLGDGLGADPYGTFQINFTNPTPGLAKVSYECRVEVDDGSPAVVYHP